MDYWYVLANLLTYISLPALFDLVSSLKRDF